MKVSYRWLRELVPVKLSPEELARRLTLQGVAVDEVRRAETVMDNVVVGEVLEVRPHPRADRLILCRVRSGEAVHQVVCGAPNVRPGGRYPLALEGALLPGGQTIHRAVVRGEASEGMLCSGWELGISDDRAGILELAPDSPIGSPAAGALRMEDWVLDCDITANRFDLHSHVGIAREVQVLTGERLRWPTVELMEDGNRIDRRVQVEVRDPEGCPRYMARVIDGIRVAQSPPWLAARLLALGQRPINNVVDVTNYVLLELGTPLHAFDLDCVGGRRVIVRRAAQGERLVTLDGVSRAMTSEMTVIADAETVMAIGGVMGGEATEVGEETRAVLLECAHFEPRRIRRTALALDLRTEASDRFQRWVDPSLLPYALDRAAGLIRDSAGGSVARGAVDLHLRPCAPLVVDLRPRRIAQVLGIGVEVREAAHLLRQVDFEVAGDDPLRITIPTFRIRDVSREIDLIEEVARLAGYDRIPSGRPASARAAARPSADERWWEECRRAWAAFGLLEAVTTSFTGAWKVQALGIPEEEAVPLRNPLSQEESLLRPLLLVGLLDVAARNIHRKTAELRLFELGTVYRSLPARQEPQEENHLAGILCGSRGPRSWGRPAEPWDFFDLKGFWETFLRGRGAGEAEFVESTAPYLRPGRRAALSLEGEGIGDFGEIHPEVAARWDLPRGLLAFEMQIDRVRAHLRPAVVRRPSGFPAIERDLSLLLPEDVPHAMVAQRLRECGGDLLEEIVLFDHYQGSQIPPGRRSLSFSLTFRAPDRTLSASEADALVETMVDRLAKEFAAERR